MGGPCLGIVTVGIWYWQVLLCPSVSSAQDCRAAARDKVRGESDVIMWRLVADSLGAMRRCLSPGRMISTWIDEMKNSAIV